MRTLLRKFGKNINGDGLNTVRPIINRKFSAVIDNANTNVNSNNIYNSNNDNNSNIEDNLVDILKRLETSFDVFGNSNGDQVLSNLKLLHNLKIVIPLSYLLDAATLFSRRNDSIRTEILLRLARENHMLNKNDMLSINNNKFQQSTRSKPLHNAYDKLVSYSINSIMKSGNSEESLKLWVGLGNSGFLTSRITLEKLLEGVSSSTQPPNIEFIIKLHNMIKINLWDQNLKHYYRLFGALRQHLKYSCNTIDDIENGLNHLNSFWKQYTTLNEHYGDKNQTNLLFEILSLKIQCYCSCIIALKRIDNDATNLKIYALCVENMISSYDELLALYSQKNSNANQSITMFDNILNTFQEDYDIPKVSDQKRTNKFSNVDTCKHYDFTNARGQLRSTTLGLLETLANDGKIDEVMEILKKYLNQYSNDMRGSYNNDNIKADVKLDLLSTLSRKFDVILAKKSRSKQKSLIQQQIWGENEIKFIDNTCSHIFQTLALNATNNFMDNFHEKCQKINNLVGKFQLLASSYEIDLGSSFYCAWIKSLGLELDLKIKSMNNEPQYPHSKLKDGDLELAFIEANRIIESVESDFSKEELYAMNLSLIVMLCSYSSNEAIEKALTVVKGIITQIDDIDTLKDSNLPSMFTTILNKAVSCMSTENHILEVSNQVDALIENFRSIHPDIEFHKNYFNINADLLKARFCVYVRLRKGYQALKIIRTMRLLGLKVEKKYFNWVIIALHKNRPISEPEWRIAKNPDETCEWILREMQRDGHKPNSRTISLMLRLYGKNCQIKKTQGEVAVAVESAFIFLIKCKNGGFMGLSKIAVTDEMLCELVKLCLLADDETRALSLLNNAETEYGIKPSSIIYEPLIYYYAGLKGAMTTTEDLLMQMVNKNVSPTTPIIDALISGFIMEDAVSDALDRIQELYTEHYVRPSVRALIKLLELSLQRKDVHEARRVVVVIQQMYSIDERNSFIDKGKVHIHPDEYEFVQSKTSDNKMKRLEKIVDMTETLENRALSDEALKERFKNHQLALE